MSNSWGDRLLNIVPTAAGIGAYLPVSKQTATNPLSIKAAAYGFEGITVDGNDAISVYMATKKALEKVRRGEGPTLIEALT